MGGKKRTSKNDNSGNDFKIVQGMPLPLGVSITGNVVNFAVESTANMLEVVLYPKSGGKGINIGFPDSSRIGNVHYMSVCNLNIDEYDYNYCADGDVFTDIRACALSGREVWAERLYEEDGEKKQPLINSKPDFHKSKPKEKIMTRFVNHNFDWKDDLAPCVRFEDTIIYRMHVRGFTKHASSAVKHKGKFRGIIEKIPYLKSLGITYIELMPAYEFDEMLELDYPAYFAEKTEECQLVNYWGYTNAFYYAPKQSYASEDAVIELKELVYALHKEGIELGMEFYFSYGTDKRFIADCLRYWLLNYHIDGFHINTEIAPADIIATDPMLARTKLFAAGWNNVQPLDRNIAVWNRNFMCTVRRFLKGDDGMVEGFVSGVLDNPNDHAVVNFLADHNCMTVRDMVSYEKKHNEANGENNNDGENYNFSWNCGIEGETKKRKILDCRLKQMKNAWVMLLCSQGIPMIMAGDEFGRTQAGNNNPYCHDNEINWINWKLQKSNKVLLDYVKQLIAFRKDNKILHMPRRLMQMDSMSCGYPDVSVHGIRAWYPDMEYYSRHTGLLYCSRYANQEGYIYIAYNMYWEEQIMALPGLDADLEWELYLRTDKGLDELIIEDRRCNMPARSVYIFISKKHIKSKK